MRITWIDDDIAIIDPVIQPLVRAGHEIKKFRSVAAALQAAEAFRDEDLILLDMILPLGGEFDVTSEGYAGIWLLQKLRYEYGIVTPVVVFSVVDPNKLTEQLQTLTVASYVRKPALPDELKKAVDAVLKEQLERRPQSSPGVGS